MLHAPRRSTPARPAPSRTSARAHDTLRSTAQYTNGPDPASPEANISTKDPEKSQATKKRPTVGETDGGSEASRENLLERRRIQVHLPRNKNRILRLVVDDRGVRVERAILFGQHHTVRTGNVPLDSRGGKEIVDLD